MFIIRSYIQYPKRLIKDFTKVTKDPLYYFIDINNTEEILRIKNDLDLCYIYGVLHLSYNNQVIIDFTNYDLIDHLWAYFLNMIKEYLQTKKSETTFPDQPLPMSMEDISDDYMLFSINFIQWKLPKYEFLNTLLANAKDFFEKMILLIEEKNDIYQVQLKKIKLLEQQINALKK
jgi:hypothetical protein